MDLSGPENVPQMGKQEQTMMWQQAQYMGDSGIHSGATTQAPSVSSKHDEMEATPDANNGVMFDFDQGFNPQGFTQEQVDGEI